MTAGGPGSGSPGVTTRELVGADLDAWRGLLARSEQGGPYASPEYLAALCAATGGSWRIVGAFLHGQLAGGLPVYATPSRWGEVVSNRTLLYYNGPVLDLPPKKFHSDRVGQRVAVLAALERHVAQGGYASVRLHAHDSLDDLRPFLAEGWRGGLSYSYVVPIADLAAQWQQVDPNLQRLIRRCEKEGVTYREDDDVAALFRLHLQTHQRRGAPLYLPEAAFRRYFEQARAAGIARLGHAIYQGQVIASQLMLTGPGRVAHTVCAGADEQYLKMGASAFLRWRSFEALAAAGYTADDLTNASLNSVTRFKSQFGGRLALSATVSRIFSRGLRLVTSWRDLVAQIRGGESPAGGAA